MGIVDILVKHKFKIHILHRLEGRLRIHIPILMMVKDSSIVAVEEINELLFLVPGVNSMEPNFITGNVLIQYNSDELSESTITKCFEVIVETIFLYRERLSRLSSTEGDKFAQKLKQYLQNNSLDLRNIKGAVVIPDELW